MWNFSSAFILGIQEFVNELINSEDQLGEAPQRKSSYLHSFRVDLLENQLENQKWGSEVDAEAEAKPMPDAKKTLLAEATKICEELAKEIDPIRKNYWEYFSRSLVSRYGEKITAERIC